MVPRKRQKPTSEGRDLTSQNTPFEALPSCCYTIRGDSPPILTSAFSATPSILCDNLHTIAILHRMVAPNLLIIKACRWTPYAGTPTGCSQLLMDFRGNIDDGCSWLHCQRFLVHLFVVAQVDADQPRELPDGFFECNQALVINDGDPDDRKIGNGCLQALRESPSLASSILVAASIDGRSIPASATSFRTSCSAAVGAAYILRNRQWHRHRAGHPAEHDLRRDPRRHQR